METASPLSDPKFTRPPQRGSCAVHPPEGRASEFTRPGGRPASLPAALSRDCAALSPSAAAKAKRFLETLATDVAREKDRWIAELVGVHEDFGREASRIQGERYEPARRDELLAQARADHLLRLRQTLERQTRAASDWLLETSDRWRTLVRADARPAHAPSPEAAVLADLLGVARRSYARSVLADNDPGELVALWRSARDLGDAATCDLIAEADPERRPPELAAETSDYRARREALRRLARADELLRWLQRERTVAHAVYDSIAEALARS